MKMKSFYRAEIRRYMQLLDDENTLRFIYKIARSAWLNTTDETGLDAVDKSNMF